MILISPLLDNYYKMRLKSVAYRKSIFQDAIDRKLRNKKLGRILLRNLNEAMAKDTALHAEFRSLIGNQDYQQIFWESDLGYMWYQGNLHAQNSFFNHALSEINRHTYESVWDIGCGWGEFIDKASEAVSVKRALGTDIAENIIAQARQNHPNSKAAFEHKDASEINEKFDLITLFGSTDYIPPEAFATMLEKIITQTNKQIIIVNSLRTTPWEKALALEKAIEIKRYDTGYVQPLNFLVSGLKAKYNFSYTIEKAGLDSALLSIKRN